jgi:hypothetical protein
VRRDRIGVAIALVALAALVGFHRVGDWDTFWQLLVGRVAVSRRSTLPVDQFSYSYAGQPFHAKDLAGYVLLYATHALGGFLALALLRTVVALAIVVLLLCRVRNALAGVIIAAALLAAIQFRLIPRALLFSELGFVALIVLLEEVRALDGPEAARRLWLAPPLLWIWINLHRGALLGYLILAGFLGYRLVTRRTLPWQLWLTLPAALLLGLVNPSGLDTFTSAVAVASHPPVVSEWHAFTPAVAWHYFPATAALLVAGWIALFWQRRAVDLWHLGLLLVTTVEGIHSLRVISFAASTAALILCRLVAASPGLRALDERRPRGALVLAAVAGGALIYVTNAHSLGVAPEPGRFPEGAVAWARSAHLGPRVHNSFIYGGYVAWAGWPEFRVLVDGRSDQLYAPEFYRRCVRAQRDAAEFAALEAELPSDWALADNTAGSESFAFLAHDPAWMLVYWSDPATVWVRRAAHPELEELHLDPKNPVQSLLSAMSGADQARLDALERELQRMLTASPESLRANALLALFFDQRGRIRERDAVLDRLEALAPDHPVVKQLRARVR